MDLVIQSFIEVIQTITGNQPTQGKKWTYPSFCSNISIQNQNYYFFCDQNLINILSQNLLGTDLLSHEEKKDLCQEFSNLVIGKAKALCADPQITIGLPKFLQNEQIPTHLKEVAHFEIQDGKCSIYKE